VTAAALTMTKGELRATNLSLWGRGGDISVNGADLNLGNEASILAFSSQSGEAGKVTLTATHSARIDGHASIGSASSGGLAGNVELTAGSFELAGGAVIQAGSLGGNSGGMLELTADSIRISEGALAAISM
jgi:hypothetical protein